MPKEVHKISSTTKVVNFNHFDSKGERKSPYKTLIYKCYLIFVLNPFAMPEILLLFFLMIPQLVAGVYAHSIGKSFWFWFFISFLIPIISLIVLLVIDNKKPKENKEDKKGYQLADHVRERKEKKQS